MLRVVVGAITVCCCRELVGVMMPAVCAVVVGDRALPSVVVGVMLLPRVVVLIAVRDGEGAEREGVDRPGVPGEQQTEDIQDPGVRHLGSGTVG